MVDIRPFQGLRFNPERVGELGFVLSPPYDVISADERRALCEGSPFNVVQVERREGGPDDRSAEAAGVLDRWRPEGVLVRDPPPSFYLYEAPSRAGGEEHTRRSLVAALRLQPWEAGEVLPHERTMAGP